MKKARILVIDDDDGYRILLRTILEMEGYEVIDAVDGCDGIKKCRMELPDLVISDIFMPQKNGLETIIELRQECPDVNIIAISGGDVNGSFDNLEAARLYGARRTFEKPVKRKEVLKAVEELLS